MPLYEYECETCQKRQDAWRKIADRMYSPLCCGQNTKQVYNYHVRTFKEYVDENITGDPTVVSSEKQRQKLLKQNGLTELYGKGWT